ncbi:adenosinetriphosphatase [Propionibacterium ruminifibrarum]|jgi:ABC-2 type transport system ATP-binding protein|uniref:Adenosinetriphosphatase n=1 Tax=Propionibacterium ruminifibrarum TaxID=1962131 RepID=A0A375I325_9ACTN|nr:ATP-binding cassette domain-containing protein [Propionibacterium ruminifibrarum]SPF68423.1 adenosinetriphosphatase [Propionibacterium ruminifibrarum]
METIIRTQGLTKAYGRLRALDEVSIEVQPGQIYGLVGQNGAGKTTLIRLLTGLARPTSGSIELFGHATGLNEQRHRIGALIDAPALSLDLTARQNLEALRIQRGLAGRHWVDEALDLVGLADTGKKNARAFSLGMRQRLGLAAAFLGNPELLILDEPVNGLDPTWMVTIRRELVRRTHEEGATILVSSHLLAELDLFASWYGFIHHGRLAQQISAEQLHARCERGLRIAVDDPARAVTVLEESLGIRRYTVTGNEIVLTERLDEAAAINAGLVAAGIAVSALEARSMSLEDYFTEIVKGA